MIHQKILMLIIFTLPLLSTKCKKERAKNPGEIVYLRDISLTAIKNEVVGNWKIHYSYGGFTGNIKTPMVGSYFKVLTNDSIYLTFNNNIFASDKAIFNRINTIFNYTAYSMDFFALGGAGYSCIVDYKIKDTLVLVDNATNPDAYIMTRIP